jgi:anaerobic dimethyl sulfoxide reductase subunit A
MSLKDKLLNQKKITRRDFIKGMSVTAAVAALPGCGGGGDAESYFDETDPNLQPPTITESYVLGSTPHNCGGGCLSKYYVTDGVVKRIVTDEDSEDGDVFEGKAQIRSCLRCRSKTDWWYRNDRLTKPLKQTKERGDITGFVEISWDQAVTEIAEKMQGIYDNYGGNSFFNCLAPSDRSDQSNCIANLTKLLGSDCSPVPWVLDLSYPQHSYSWFFIDHGGLIQETGTAVSLRTANYRADIINSDNLVLWAFNPMEARVGAQTGWFVTRAKEEGVKVTVIDPRFTRTAEFADDYIGIAGTTDAALMLGMLHYLITETWDEDGSLKAGALLDEAFIRKYVHGFFDDTNPKHYYADIDAVPTAYQVPAGASLSAYIMGDDDRLTKAVMSSEAEAYTRMTSGATVNQGISVYPETIGYNVPDTDALYNKTAPIYGQQAKTPEWASKITGVSVEKIKELARMYATTKVTTWVSGGLQRHSEGEQPVNLGPILAAVTKNFGVNGRSYGFSHEVNYKYPGTMLDKVKVCGPNAGSCDISADTYDFSKLTLQGGELGAFVGNNARMPLCNAIMMNGLSLAAWVDYVRCAGTDNKSKWNYGRANASTHPVKALFGLGGNFVNQTGNSQDITELCKAKDENGNYNIEMIITGDLFLTASSLISDYVLPCAGPGEKWGETCGWLTAEAMIMPKFTEAPGEALNEFEIARRIAAKLGKEEEYKTMADGSGTVVENDYEWSEYNWNKGYAEGQIDENWDDIQKIGGVFMQRERPDKVKYIPKKGFRADPATNPLNTMSGKIEAYYQGMLEDYEAGSVDSIDRVTSDPDSTSALYHGGSIYTASTAAEAKKRRFVYPVAMYIPALEGRHADGSHPDLFGREAAGFKFKKQVGHYLYRAHSTAGNTGILNELYKRDANGNRAHLSADRAYSDGVWDDNVYEPVYINPVHSDELDVLTGDRVLVVSNSGSMYGTVVLTNRIAPYDVSMGDGGWFCLNSNGKDLGGSSNALSSGRPSRIAFGMTFSSDDRLKIEKA